VAKGARRSRQGAGGRRGDPALLAALPVPGAVLGPAERGRRGHHPAGVPGPARHRRRHRDERFFDAPDAFDIDRPPSLALGFGYGIHSCLGAALARMESRIAIGELARRWPRYDIDEAGLRRVTMSNVAGYSNVPVHVIN